MNRVSKRKRIQFEKQSDSPIKIKSKSKMQKNHSENKDPKSKNFSIPSKKIKQQLLSKMLQKNKNIQNGIISTNSSNKSSQAKPPSTKTNYDKIKMSNNQKASFYKQFDIQKLNKIHVFKKFANEIIKKINWLNNEAINEEYLKNLVLMCLLKFLLENPNDTWGKIYKPYSSNEVFF